MLKLRVPPNNAATGHIVALSADHPELAMLRRRCGMSRRQKVSTHQVAGVTGGQRQCGTYSMRALRLPSWRPLP